MTSETYILKVQSGDEWVPAIQDASFARLQNIVLAALIEYPAYSFQIVRITTYEMETIAWPGRIPIARADTEPPASHRLRLRKREARV